MEKIVDYGYISVVWNFFISHFKNEIGVAGLLGNFYGESYIVPYIVQNNLKPPFEKSQNYTDKLDRGEISENAFVNSGGGYGFAQWTIPERKKPYWDFAKNSGESFGSWEVGCGFSVHELESGSYNEAKNAVYNGTNLRDVVRTILKKYEMPQDQSENAVARRTNYAQQILDMMKGASPIPPVENGYIKVSPKSLYIEKNAITSIFIDASGEWEYNLGNGIIVEKNTDTLLEVTTNIEKEEKRTATFWLKDNPQIKTTLPLGINIIIPVPPEDVVQITPKEIYANALQTITFDIIASYDYGVKIETGAKVIKKTSNFLVVKIDGAYSRPDIKVTVYLTDNTTVQDYAIIHIKDGGRPPVSSKSGFKLFYLKPKIKL